MDVKDVFAAAEFSNVRMQKINLFETKNFFCDIYCLEPDRNRKSTRTRTKTKSITCWPATDRLSLETRRGNWASIRS